MNLIFLKLCFDRGVNVDGNGIKGVMNELSSDTSSWQRSSMAVMKSSAFPLAQRSMMKSDAHETRLCEMPRLTVGEFAKTKFGSLKTKDEKKRVMPIVSLTSGWSNYIEQKGGFQQGCERIFKVGLDYD